jgi:hypothetical protein
MSPDAIRGLSRAYKLWPACHIHDFHYRTVALTFHEGGTPAARSLADNTFYVNLRTLTRMQGASAVMARSIALLYWGRVRIWGAKAYNFRGAHRPVGFWSRVREVWTRKGRGDVGGSA